MSFWDLLLMLFVFLLFVCPKVADVAAHANCTDQNTAAASGKRKENGILAEQTVDSFQQQKENSGHLQKALKLDVWKAVVNYKIYY